MKQLAKTPNDSLIEKRIHELEKFLQENIKKMSFSSVLCMVNSLFNFINHNNFINQSQNHKSQNSHNNDQRELKTTDSLNQFSEDQISQDQFSQYRIKFLTENASRDSYLRISNARIDRESKEVILTTNFLDIIGINGPLFAHYIEKVKYPNPLKNFLDIFVSRILHKLTSLYARNNLTNITHGCSLHSSNNNTQDYVFTGLKSMSGILSQKNHMSDDCMSNTELNSLKSLKSLTSFNNSIKNSNNNYSSYSSDFLLQYYEKVMIAHANCNWQETKTINNLKKILSNALNRKIYIEDMQEYSLKIDEKDKKKLGYNSHVGNTSIGKKAFMKNGIHIQIEMTANELPNFLPESYIPVNSPQKTFYTPLKNIIQQYLGIHKVFKISFKIMPNTNTTTSHNESQNISNRRQKTICLGINNYYAKNSYVIHIHDPCFYE